MGPGEVVSKSVADGFESVKVEEAEDSEAAGPGGLVTSGTDECSSGGGHPPARAATVSAGSWQDEHTSNHESMLKEGTGTDNETENAADIGAAPGSGVISVPDECNGGEESEGFCKRAGASVSGVPVSVAGTPAADAAESLAEIASSDCKSGLEAAEGVAETTVPLSAAGICLSENGSSDAAAAAAETAAAPGEGGEATVADAGAPREMDTVDKKDGDVAGDAEGEVSSGSPEAEAVLPAHEDELDEDITGDGVACSDQQGPVVDGDMRITDEVPTPSPGSPSSGSTPGSPQQQSSGVVGHDMPSPTSTSQPNGGVVESSSSPAPESVSGPGVGSSSPHALSSPSSCASLRLKVTADEPTGGAQPSVSPDDTHLAAQTTTGAPDRSNGTADTDIPTVPVTADTVKSTPAPRSVGGISVAKSLARSFMAGERRHSASARRSSGGGAGTMFFRSRSPADSKARRNSESKPVLSRTAELLSGERKGGLAALEEQVRD